MKPRSHSRWPTVLLVVLQLWFAAGFLKAAVFGDVMPLTRVVAVLLAAFLAYRVMRNTRELVRQSRAEQK